MTVKIHGASDDIVYVETEESNYDFSPNMNDVLFLALSNGVAVKVEYEGDWKITRHSVNTEVKVALHQAHEHDVEGARDYSDVLVMEGDVDWVIKGDKIHK